MKRRADEACRMNSCGGPLAGAPTPPPPFSALLNSTRDVGMGQKTDITWSNDGYWGFLGEGMETWHCCGSEVVDQAPMEAREGAE